MLSSTLKTTLYDLIAPHVAQVAQLSAWLNALDASTDGARLAACLAIDMLSGAIEPESYGAIVDALPTTYADPGAAFEAALETLRASGTLDLACHSLLPAPTAAPADGYVRLVTMREFIDYYVGPTHKYTADPAGANRVRKKYFRYGPSGLGDIRKWWGGRKNVVWVASRQAVNHFANSFASADAAGLMLDAFGLAKPSGIGGGLPELIAIEYPPTFDAAIGCVAPTAADAWWGAPTWFYLSSQNALDGWGRTFSCTATLPEQRERVHSHFKNLTNEYTARLIGFARAPVADRVELVNEAARRFEAMVSLKNPKP